jgi:serine/threonine-protein kinase ATR
MLQAQQRKTPYCFIESARLLKATGEPLRALNELQSSSTLLGLFNDQVVDLTADAESDRMKAKVCIYRLLNYFVDFS